MKILNRVFTELMDFAAIYGLVWLVVGMVMGY